MHEDGHGVPQDFEKALELYEKAANKGDRDCLYTLSKVHAHGILNKPQNTNKAMRLLRRAAAKGHPAAELEILAVVAAERSSMQQQQQQQAQQLGTAARVPCNTYTTQSSCSEMAPSCEWVSTFNGRCRIVAAPQPRRVPARLRKGKGKYDGNAAVGPDSPSERARRGLRGGSGGVE